MSCIRLVGDADVDDVIRVANVIDMTDAGSEAVPRMGLGSRRLRPHSKGLRSTLLLLARYSLGLRKGCVLGVVVGMAHAVDCSPRTMCRRHLANNKRLAAYAYPRTCLGRNEGHSMTCLGKASHSRRDPRN
jgi:hypothetical protein